MNDLPPYVPSGGRRPWPQRLRSALRAAAPVCVWFAAALTTATLALRRPWSGTFPGTVVVARGLLTAPGDGLVHTVLVALHDSVEAGQALVRLDDADVRLRLEQARLELERLRADLALAEAEIDREVADERAKAELDAAVERRRLASTVELARVDALLTRAELEEARVRLEGASVVVERTEPLTGQGMVSDTELVRRRTERDALSRRIAELEIAQQGQLARIDAAHQRLEEFSLAQPSMPLRDVLLEPMRLRIREQEAEIERQVHVASSLVLRSPARGRVESIATAHGAYVREGTVLVTVTDSTPLHLLGYVPAGPKAVDLATATVEVRDAATGLVLGEAAVRSVSPAVVPIPQRFWRDPAREERAFEVVLAATGRETPGGDVSLALR